MAGKIKTVVVLVQENRSFDHMLGWMKSLNPEIDGVTGAEVNHAVAGDATSPAVHFGNASQYVDPDPGHSFMAIYEQVYGDPYTWGSGAPATKPGVASPPMSGFAQQAEKEKPGMSHTVMNGFRPDAVPVYRELVREFAVCDRWFASVPTSTQPNRMFVHSATSHGLVGNDKKMLRAGMPQRTIFDALHDAGHSFGIYYQFPPAVLFYRSVSFGQSSSFPYMQRQCKQEQLVPCLWFQ
jgi:phospholipase C